MAKRKPAYDMDNARDREIVAAAKRMGRSTKARIPQGEEDAMLALTDKQQVQLRGQGNHIQTREHDGQSAKRASPITRSCLPMCLWALSDANKATLEDFAVIYWKTIPSQTVSLAERVTGGSMSDNPYDHDALDEYGAFTKGISRKHRTMLEWAVTRDSHALISQARWEGILSAIRHLQRVLN